MSLNGSTVKTDSILTKVVGKGLGFMQAFIREYPGFAYLGIAPLNTYKMQRNLNGSGNGSMQEREKVNEASFGKIGKIESTLNPDPDGKAYYWHEGKEFQTSTVITADSATDKIVVENVEGFAVNDIVRTMPAKGSAGTETQATITDINTGTKTITLSTTVDVKDGDQFHFLAPTLTLGQKVTREVAEGDTQECKSFLQKFGGSVVFKQEDLNKTRLFQDAKTYIGNKFYGPIAQAFENIISMWFFGQNTGGNAPQTEGMITLINAREARNQESIFDFSTATNDRERLDLLRKYLNRAATSPVYSGNEKPTVFCTTAFISEVSGILQSVIQYNDFIPKTLEYGLESLTTPYFRNITFIISPEMDRKFGADVQRALVFPKELVGFRTHEIQGVDMNGNATKTQTRFALLKQPQVTHDEVEYTAEIKLANIFGGQSYDNSYMLLKDFK